MIKSSNLFAMLRNPVYLITVLQPCSVTTVYVYIRWILFLVTST